MSIEHEWFGESRTTEDNPIIALHKFVHDAPYLTAREYAKGLNPWLSCFLSNLTPVKTNLYIAAEVEGQITAEEHAKLDSVVDRIAAEVNELLKKYSKQEDAIPIDIQEKLFGELYGLLPD
jgi:hypothetical protein